MRLAAFRGEGLLWGAGTLLFMALIFGGGGAEAPFFNGLLDAGGALLLCATVAGHFTGRPLPVSATAPVILLAAVLLLIAAQLVPLPPAWGNALPGREAAAAAFALSDDPGRWRPLSLDPEATRRFAAALLLPAGLFLAIIRAGPHGRIVMVRIIVAGALISFLVAAIQLALGLPVGLYPYGPPGAGVPTGLFANPNHLAQLMLAALVASGLLIRSSNSQRRRPTLNRNWVLLPIFMGGAIVTQSRAAILLLIPAVLAATLIAIGHRRLGRVAGVSALAIGIAAVIAILIPGGLERGAELQMELSAGGRLTNLPDLLFTLGQFWPWGSGFGTFVPVFQANENLDLMGNLIVNHAHNDLIELLIEGGLPAALLLAAATLAIAVRLWRLVSGGHSGDLGGPLTGLAIIAVGLLHSLVDYPLRMPAIAAVSAVALALFAAPVEAVESGSRMVRTRHSRGIWAIFLLVGALIGLQAVRMGLGQAAVRAKDGPLAASVRPQNGWGLALLAERQLEQGRAALAAQTSRAALGRTPLAVVALRTLARAEDKLHGPGSGEQAWQAASLLGWRDRQVQVWAALRALSNGQADIFAMRADALMRTGDPDELMTRFIRQAAVEPRIRRALIARLAIDPPWRTRFFQAEKPPTGEALRGVVAVLNDLGGQSPPTRQDLRDAIAGLIAAGRIADAIALDRRYIRRIPDAGSLLDDGGFELADSDYQTRATPFDWAIDPRSAEIDRSGGQRRIAVFANGSPDPALRRFIALSAGRYRLQFALSGPADAGASLQFAAICATSGAPLGASPPAQAGENGQAVAFDFEVPAGCGLVLFTMRRLQAASSDALIDDVRLERI